MASKKFKVLLAFYLPSYGPSTTEVDNGVHLCLSIRYSVCDTKQEVTIFTDTCVLHHHKKRQSFSPVFVKINWTETIKFLNICDNHMTRCIYYVAAVSITHHSHTACSINTNNSVMKLVVNPSHTVAVLTVRHTFTRANPTAYYRAAIERTVVAVIVQDVAAFDVGVGRGICDAQTEYLLL
jgi:hypothetical protein